jgi:hypothetical protein
MRIWVPLGRDNPPHQIHSKLTKLAFLRCGRLGTKLE